MLWAAGTGPPPSAWAFEEPLGGRERSVAVDMASASARQRLAASAETPPSQLRGVRQARPAVNRRAAMTAAMRLARRRTRRPGTRRFAWPLRVPQRLRVLDLGLRSAAIEVAVDTARQRVTTADGAASRFSSTQVQERLSLRNTGAYVYDPRVLTFSLGGDIGLSPDWSTRDTGRLVQTGTLWSYDALTSVLPQSATSLDLFAKRQHSLLSREFASQSEWISEDRGATLFASRLPMPSTLTVRRELQEEESHIGEAAAQREDWRTIVTYEGRRGWVNHDLDLRGEWIDLTAARTPSLDYRSQEASLRHGIDFGPETNRHLESRLRYFTRAGNTELTTFTADESLRVDHRDDLWTDTRYLLASNDAAGQTSTVQTLTTALHHQLYESLATTVGGEAERQALSGGTKHLLRHTLDLAYVKRVPWQGRLHAGLGGQLAYQRDRFETTESFVPQETHAVASPVATPVTLDSALVEASSLVVTKTALGPVPTGCTTPSGPPVPLVLGRDYTVVEVNGFAQIIPRACAGASPGINPGDTIAADYQFRVSPSVSFTTTGWRGEVSVDYPWVRPYVAHEQSAQQLQSGWDGGQLENRRSEALGVEVRSGILGVDLDLLGELSRYAADRLTYDRLRSSQLLSWSLRPEVTLTFSTEQSFFDFSEPAHSTRHLTGQVTLAYAPRPGVVIDCSAHHRVLMDTLLPEERNTELSIRARWFIRQLELEPRLNVFEWRRGGTRAREYRAFLRAIRRF